MRLVTWNLNRATWQGRRRFPSSDAHARASWEEVGSLNADVALLQEATPPPSDLTRPPTGSQPARRDPENWRSMPGPRRWWCSAVAAWNVDLQAPSDEDRCEPLYVSQRGAYAVGMVTIHDIALVVASVYALWDYGWLRQGTKPRYAHTSLHRAISDLTPRSGHRGPPNVRHRRRGLQHVFPASDPAPRGLSHGARSAQRARFPQCLTADRR
jgi:hypothetical protein